MENGTNTSKFPNCISCVLRSGDTEIKLGLVKNRPLCSVIGDHVTCVAWRILGDERNARE